MIAIRDGEGRELSYRDLHERAEAVATVLAGRPGTCVIELRPGIDHAIAMHAAILAGISFQTVRPGLPAAERAAALAGIADAIEFDPFWLQAEAPTAPPRPTPPGPDAALCRVLTSGTSGVRTAVELTHANHFAAAAASAFNLGVDLRDRWLCCMPVDHVGGLSILIRSLIYGTGAIVHERFDADRVAAELGGEATIVSLVATQLQRLLETGAPLEAPRLILLGGGPVPDAVLDEALGRGANVVQTYGLTQACSQVCTLSVADAGRKRGSAGRPLLGTEVELDQGPNAEILVRGPTVAPAAAGPDGWLRTGDRGRIDEQGYLWVEGRLDGLIVSGGENVAPEEVEAALLSHRAVAEVAVIGRPDPEWGAAVTALVVAGGEVEAEELVAHCRRDLAAHKLPKRVQFVSELPRTETGKLLRRELR